MIRKSAISLLCLGMVSVSAAHAAPWSGSATSGNFSYASTPGGDGGTVFSAPTAIGDTLIFNTPGLGVLSDGAGIVSADGFVEFEINIAPGLVLDFVAAGVGGAVNVNGTDSKVDLNVSWEVRDDVLGASLSQTSVSTTPLTFPYEFVPASPNNNTGFSGDNTLGGIGSQLPAWGQVLVIRLDIGVMAEAIGDGTASIDIAGSGLELGFFFVPEPSTVALMFVGGMALIRRRR